MAAKSANTSIRPEGYSLMTARLKHADRSKGLLRFKHRPVEPVSILLNNKAHSLTFDIDEFSRTVTDKNKSKPEYWTQDDDKLSHIKIIKKSKPDNSIKPGLPANVFNLPRIPSQKKSSKSKFEDIDTNSHPQNKGIHMNRSMDNRKFDSSGPVLINNNQVAASQLMAVKPMLYYQIDFRAESPKAKKYYNDFPKTNFGDEKNQSIILKQDKNGYQPNWRTNHFEKLHQKGVAARQSRGFFIMQKEGSKSMSKGSVPHIIPKNQKLIDKHMAHVLEVKDCFMPETPAQDSMMGG